MDPKGDSIRDRLLSRLPEPANLDAYRKEVAVLLAKNEKGFRREKWGTAALLLLAVAFLIVLLTRNGLRLDTPAGFSYAGSTFAFFLYALAEVLKHFINRARVDLLKEVKQTQVQILELHALLTNGGARTSSQP